jgi:hypothetical protein
MSKDKGSKNHKKAPADKTSGKSKESDYKSEGKSGSAANPNLEVFAPKTDPKTIGGKKKS